jgi:S1-C subfamily serine protease
MNKTNIVKTSAVFQLLVTACLAQQASGTAESRAAPGGELSQRCVAAVVVDSNIRDARSPDWPIYVAVGTAFVLENKLGYLATNAHVVREAGARIGESIVVGLRYPLRWAYKGEKPRINVGQKASLQNMSMTIRARVVEVDDESDVALLRARDGKTLDENCSPRLSTDLPRPGAQIVITGYPLFAEVPITIRTHVATELFQGSQIEFARYEQNLKRTGKKPYIGARFLVDATIYGGSSGSPVQIGATGPIVGIASGSLASPLVTGLSRSERELGSRAFGYVIPIYRLLQMLDKEKVSYAK